MCSDKKLKTIGKSIIGVPVDVKESQILNPFKVQRKNIVKVISVGNDVKSVNKGDVILLSIDAMSIQCDHQELLVTNEDCVMGIINGN